ncbi:MAG: 4-hydroxy-3-methylbut-2-enyl diphosphate reductase [Rhodothalassiaceae bacterium]
MSKPELHILLAAPRGFCAGVDRAIKIVELAIERYGAPVYVRHEIVHNRHVVEELEAKGAVFVEELDEVPDGAPVVFSAHGVPKSVPAEADRRALFYVDATCPLVSKVHREVEHHDRTGHHILMIGHAGHPEVIGTMGQVAKGSMTLIESIEDAEAVMPADPDNLAFVTQTTLSIDDTAGIVEVLRRRFPNIAGPRKEDICYATTNRQEAVKAIAGRCDRMLIIGAPNSSNSRRLVEVAEKAGAPARLVQKASEIDWEWLGTSRTIGISAGASAPEILVQDVLAALMERFDVRLEEIETAREAVTFKLPAVLRDTAA